MTTSQHPESPYKSNNTASNMAGVTLMNNQVGAVVAQVMAQKDNVTVTYLPSMIRVEEYREHSHRRFNEVVEELNLNTKDLD